jgi:hypothetical protein
MDVSGITRKGGSLGTIRMIMHRNPLKTCYRESEIEAGFQSKVKLTVTVEKTTYIYPCKQ